MSDEHKKTVKAKIDNAIFTYAAACHIDNLANEAEVILNNMPEDSTQYYIENRTKMIILHHIRKEKISKMLSTVRKALLRVSIALLIFITIFTLLISTVEGFRIMIFNLIIEPNSDYSKISVQESDSVNNNVDNAELKGLYIPKYIPESFILSSLERLQVTTVLTYKDNINNYIIFEQSSNVDKALQTDTEDSSVEYITINGQKGLLIEKNNIVTLVWSNGEQLFNIFGTAKEEDIISMAESLTLN